MKKLIMAIFVLAGISVMAQDNNSKDQRNAMTDLSPDQIATLQTKRMTLALDLNDSQQSKMKSLLTENAKTRKTKMEEFKARKNENRQLTSNEKFALQNARLDYKISQKKEMKSLLTAAQFAKWEKMKHKKRGMHHNGKKNRDRSKINFKKD